MDEVLPKTAPDSPQGVLGVMRNRHSAHSQGGKNRQRTDFTNGKNRCNANLSV